jgi:hypothetical protein
MHPLCLAILVLVVCRLAHFLALFDLVGQVHAPRRLDVVRARLQPSAVPGMGDIKAILQSNHSC